MTQPLNAVDSRELFRQKLLSYVSELNSGAFRTEVANVSRLFSTLPHDPSSPFAPRKVDWAAIVEYWDELRRVGAVATLGSDVPGWGGGSSIPQFIVTPWGRKLLEGAESSPSNPGRYFADLQERIGALDPVALVYLREARDAWEHGLPRSSAVMLGCACERLVRMLADAIQKAGDLPFAKNLADHEKRVSSGKAPPMAISEMFNQVRGALLARVEDGKLSGDLADIVERRLAAIFDHVRVLRNKSGHPTAEEVSIEDAHAGLLLFPGFHQTVSRLVAALQAPLSNG